jgi:CHAT domain-containing protein
MFRILVLIFFVIGSIGVTAQGIGEFALMSQKLDEGRYRLFMKAAREDGDSTKVIMLRALHAWHLLQQQQYPQAETELYTNLALIKKLEGNLYYSMKMVTGSVFDTFDYLGEYYTNQGDYKTADYFLKQSERLRTIHFSRGSPHRIFNIQNLVEFYLATDQTDNAEAYLNKLNTELNHTRFNNVMLKAAYGVYFKGMTEVKIKQGKLTEGQNFFKKYVKFNSSGLTSYKSLLRSLSAPNKSVYFRSQLLLMEGKAQEALEVAVKGIDQHPDSVKILPPLLTTKAICQYRLGNLQEAIATAGSLLELHLRNINKSFKTLNEQEKETMFNRVKDDFDLYNSLVIAATAGKMIDAATLENSLNFRLQTKALLMNNSLKIRQAIFTSGDTVLINNYKRLSVLKNKVAQDVYKKKDKENQADYENQIKSLEKIVSRRVAALDKTKGQKLSAADLQRRLAQDEAAVEVIRVRKLGVAKRIAETNQPVYALTDTILYFSIILKQQGIDYALSRNGNDMETRFFKLFKNEVQLVSNDTLLYNAYWSAIGRKVGEKKTVFFSGDGIYNQLNISLINGPDGYLEDKYDMVLLSNLKEITHNEGSITKGSAIFFGDPNFKLTVQSSESDATREVRNVQMEDMKDADFKALPGTGIEIQNGSRVLLGSGWKIESFLGDKALESNLKSINNPEILHIATHGFFIEGAGINPMLRSGLIFSGVKNPEDIQGEDGVLTAYEASSLSLDSTHLVVLSACETGGGEVRTGEGVYGLQRAFLIAGARNIIMSLWKVDDAATQKLMTLFYTNLSIHKNIRLAFTEAQKTLRKEYPEPFYWGAFVLVGK